MSAKFNTFYSSHVVLPQADQDELHAKKNINVQRLKDGLEEYNKEMKNIDTYITNIKMRCTGIYNDSEINKVCNSYKTVYEKIVNLYISDIDNYNNFITKYNENKNDKLELIEKIHKDYIDYDEDGIVYGGASDEENKN